MEAQAFFSEFVAREEQVAELKAEMKDMLDAFAASNNLTSKGIAKGVKEYKEFLKDKALFTVTDNDADRIFEALAK
jgi:hypothetical protein